MEHWHGKAVTDTVMTRALIVLNASIGGWGCQELFKENGTSLLLYAVINFFPVAVYLPLVTSLVSTCLNNYLSPISYFFILFSYALVTIATHLTIVTFTIISFVPTTIVTKFLLLSLSL